MLEERVHEEDETVEAEAEQGRPEHLPEEIAIDPHAGAIIDFGPDVSNRCCGGLVCV